ncbi:MAG TPA: acyl-CoA dehydrogenase family protein [Polyangiaceae bacterium]|nr:acyl-CoA dehydrogenase family protein [Polyangiaceae bacterium]
MTEIDVARTPETSSSEEPAWLPALQRIAKEVTGPAATAVDREARFPRESFAALSKGGFLGAAVPVSLGGMGASIEEMSVMCETLGRRCAATAMVFAMHHIQVACIERHRGSSRFFAEYLREVAEKQRLIASVTSEAGVGGSTRTSVAPIERDGELCKFRKDGTVVSYGENADDLLVTVRRSADAPMNDQALVLVRRSACSMERTGSWDTLGMRGTCSPGYIVAATFPEEQVLESPFSDISSMTMVPFAHLLWGSAWLGIAADAVARARMHVRDVARQMPGTVPPGAVRLSEVSTPLQLMRTQIRDLAREFDSLASRPDRGKSVLTSVGYALRMNALKISSSELVVDIVTRALRIVGTSGYRNDSRYSLTRHLRDAHSAALMIGNERMHGANAALLLVHKDD